ncbi:hypothetical protein GCM10023149_30990 [Mucilaginibacter gynuensis]|uniref:Uncharacterized protein n=1 Tax=Mucilaginibacter gynuensis TaxID=1302236 RepID=A0ABP8GNG9_9SPHI
MPNPKADIHQWTWYESRANGKKYLCTSAGWCYDDEAQEWRPQNIHLLEYMTCEPQFIEYDKMIRLLEQGHMVVLKLPY